jgi:Rieske Fe-S protein
MNEFDELASPEQRAKEQDRPSAAAEAPLPAAAERGAKHSRRIFLFKLSLGLNAVVGAVLAVPVLGYVLGPMFKKDASENSWIPLMAIDSIPVGATRLVQYVNPARFPSDGDTDKVACWSRRLTASTYEVFAINCAHLGCPVRWFEQSQLFLCPCHGGAYYANGDRASGPPPRGLFKYKLRYTGGQVYIDAGEMPTLATQACNEKSKQPLVQIETISHDDASANVRSDT